MTFSAQGGRRPLSSSFVFFLALVTLGGFTSAAPAAARSPDALRPVDDCLGEEMFEGRGFPSPELRRFRHRGLRVRRPPHAWATPMLNPLVDPYDRLEVWTPSATRLNKIEALEFVGADDLAARQAWAVGLSQASFAVGLGGSLAGMLIGMVGGGALALVVYDHELGQEESAFLFSMTGLLVGAFAPLAAGGVGMGVAALLAVSDDEALGPILQHNREQAEKAGLDESEIPFEYLGY